MTGEIQAHETTTTMSLTKAKKRWRLAYYTIYFAKTVAKSVIYKVPVSEVPQIVVSSETSIDQTQVVQSKDLETIIMFGGVKGLAKTLHTELDHGLNGRDSNKMRIVFGSNNAYEIPNPVGLFYFAVEAFFKDVKINLNPQIVLSEGGTVNIEDMSGHHVHSIDQRQLTDMVQNEDLKMLQSLDGVKGLAKTLDKDLEKGITGQDLSNRRSVFGSNAYEKQPPKGLFYFVAQGFSHIPLRILMVCAALSIGFGIKEDGLKYGWYEGGSILVAVFLVIVLSAVKKFKQEKTV